MNDIAEILDAMVAADRHTSGPDDLVITAGEERAAAPTQVRHLPGKHLQDSHGGDGVVKNLAGKFPPKRDMTFKKFRDFQDALGNGDVELEDTPKVYPDDIDYSGSGEEKARRAAGPVAARWNVDRADLVELVAAQRRVTPESLADADADELKAQYVEDAIVGHNTSGSVATIIAGVTIAEKQGWPVELTETQQGQFDYVKERPAIHRALTSLGEAQYETTQAWFRERGITEVTIARGMSNREGDREGLPFTSWSTSYGGVIGSVGAGFNNDYSDPEVLQKEYDQERSIRVATIPVERIYSTAVTGPGTKHESEVVVLSMPKSGNPDDDPVTKKYQQARPGARARRDGDTLRLLGVVRSAV